MRRRLRAADEALRTVLPGRLQQALVTSLVAVGVALLLARNAAYPEWFFPRMTGVGALLYALALVIFGFAFREQPGMSKDRAQRHRRARRQLQNVAGGGFALGLLGTLGVYQLHLVGFDYDKALHFGVPACGTFAVTRFLQRHVGRTKARSSLLAAGIVVSVALAWEAAELASDLLVGTRAVGMLGEAPVLDTLIDVGLDLSGILLGALAARGKG